MPAAVAGHSSGEISAAYAAGILPLESCMTIAYNRGMSAKELKRKFRDLKGAMLAVGSCKEGIVPFITQLTNKNVRIACFNSPTSLTISGDATAIDELQILMEQNNIFNRKLQVDVAYHSHHMKLIADYYRESLRSLVSPKSTDVKFHSSLLGHIVSGSQLEASYWVDNLTQSVRFSDALESMCRPFDNHKNGVDMIVEIGPHSALAGPVKQVLNAYGGNAIPYASALVKQRDAVETILELASKLFVRGAILDLGAINFPRPNKPPVLLVDMPRYPWNHQTRYWHEPRMMQKHKGRTTPRNDLLGILANYSNDMEPTWRNIVRIDELPWLRHHKVQSLTLFPMSGFVAMAIEAAAQRAALRNIQYDKFELRNISVSTPLMITDEEIEVTLQLRPHQQGTLVSSEVWDEFRIHSWSANKGWTEHSKGIIAVKCKDCDDPNSEALLQTAITKITGAGIVSVDKSKIYNSLSDLGVSYGPSFQGMNNCQASDSFAVASITVADTAQEMPQGFQASTIIHPAFLEQLIEMYWPILGAGRTSVDTIYLPSSIKRMTVSRQIAELAKKPGDSLQAFCQVAATHLYPKPIQASMFATATNHSKEALVMLDDLTISPILEKEMTSNVEIKRKICYKLEWEPILRPLCSSLPNGILNKISDCIPNGISELSNGVSEHSNGVSELSNGLTNGTLNGIVNGLPKISNGTWHHHKEAVAIVHGDSESQHLLASMLAGTVEHVSGNRPYVGTLQDINADGKLCIFILELEKPLLSSLTHNQFTALQKLLTSVQGVLWVVQGAYDKSCNPTANMISGLSRSIRSESLLKFATLDLDQDSSLCEEGTVEAILNIFNAIFGANAEANCELEFTERKGVFFTPRIINDEEMDEYVHNRMKAFALEPTLFAQDFRPLKMAIKTLGDLETMYFDDQSMDEPLLDDEIEIQVKAIGVNSKEVMATMGLRETSDFGSECSGIITRIGKDVANFAVGNQCSGISVSRGVYSTYARIKAAYALRMSDNTSFEAAASIPVAYCTAYYGLVDLGRLLTEERLLIHGATTPAGQAAIHLAQMIGAEVFATVSSVGNKEFLKEVYDLRDDHIFSSHNASFGSAFRQATSNGRFDVVLDCLNTDTDTLRDIWDCLGSFGRFVETGQRDAGARLETACFDKNRSFTSVDLISLAIERPKTMQRLVENLSRVLSNGKIIPVNPISVFPISDVENAFKLFYRGNIDGKLVVSLGQQDSVKVRVRWFFPRYHRILLTCNCTSGHFFEQEKEVASFRCFLYPNWRYRWPRTKYGSVDGE